MSVNNELEPTLTPGPVPAVLEVGDDVITVDRAWPRARRGDAEVVLAEGRDRWGRIRAAQLRMRPASGLGWQVSSVRVAPHGADPKLPDLSGASRSGTVVVHRYGKRAVVRRPDRYVKVVRPGTGPEIAAAARHGQTVAEQAGFEAPAVLEAGPGAVSFSILPGRSLHELGGVATRGEWSRWWQRWAVRWAALARPAADSGLATHSAHDEVVNLRRWLDRVDRLEALPAAVSHHVTARAEAVTTELVTGRAQELVVSHRDLHDKQILAHDASLGLLDFDTVSLAEPALDLANLWVHAVLRTDQGVWSRGHSEVAQQAILEVAEGLGVDSARFETYAEATRLRLACLYSFRPRHRSLALDWASASRPSV
ncbi:phosphotransferase [Ornithinimicrobium sp. F0845]|uniref:phosphotransferase n=1 Tax=Ornithinimicrobium sp. F0845 TaxID=2926412 RepID=UPI001FF10EF2|nr:phosphotransferase [Ornithinimicrobium sp. F0845]MCK0113551.1 phosphotransferase [Ornithinimicrobium sp. F0845]